jgi:hypothetical protein
MLKIFNPLGFLIIGFLMGIFLLSLVNRAFSERLEADYSRLTLSNVYDALEEERLKLDGITQRIGGIQEELRTAARIYDDEAKKVRLQESN